MELVTIIESIKTIIIGAIDNLSWIFAPITMENKGEIITFSPVMIVSFGALSVLIVVAVAKWIIS